MSREDLSEKNVNAFLYTAGQVYPVWSQILFYGDISKTVRTSGFMIWQGAYSEIFFTKKLFPDINEENLDEAVDAYHLPERRFGK